MARYFLIVAFLFRALICISQSSQTDFAIPQPDSLPQKVLMKLWATQYYIHQFQSSGTIPFVNTQGDSLGLFADTCNFCKAALEGTAYVTDRQGQVFVLNVAHTGTKSYVDCRQCAGYRNSTLDIAAWGKKQWVIATGFGYGVKNYYLVPFRTIAVDPSVIPYGTVLYIPEARGLQITLPNGTKVLHDGYFFAGDTGSAIKGNHIDIFTGIEARNPFQTFLKSDAKETFRAFQITSLKSTLTLSKIHLKP